MSEPIHTVQPPPENSALTQQVAQILAAELAIAATATALADLLIVYGVTRSAIFAALQLTKWGTKHQARVMGRAARRQVAAEDLYFRAAYILNSSRRIQEHLDSGGSLTDVLATERRYYQQHEAARRNRLDSADAVDRAARLYGDWLGWFLNPLLNNEIECITANGHNFHVDQRPVIGWPGSVHMGCGCRPGPPIAGAGTVDDATKPVLRFARAPRYRLRAS